jgi:hypothetical protein
MFEILAADHLTFIENIALLTILTQQTERSEDPDHLSGICVSGQKDIDRKIIENFIENKLFIETSNTSEIFEYKNVNYNEINNIIKISYASLIERKLNPKEIQEIQDAITLIQAKKLDALALHISKTYEIPVEGSNKSLALLYHLISEYSLNDLLPLFHWEARKTKKYTKKERPKNYISGKLLFKNISLRIEKDKNLDLKNYWKLPSIIKTSPLEAIFSDIYLDEHVNWNSLSPKDIIAKLLKITDVI